MFGLWLKNGKNEEEETAASSFVCSLLIPEVLLFYLLLFTSKLDDKIPHLAVAGHYRKSTALNPRNAPFNRVQFGYLWPIQVTSIQLSPTNNLRKVTLLHYYLMPIMLCTIIVKFCLHRSHSLSLCPLHALAVNVVCREWGFSNQLKWHRHRKYLFTWVGDYWVETAGGLPSAANVWSSLLFAKLDINCICINHTLLWAILLRPRSEIRLVCGRGGWRCGGKQ